MHIITVATDRNTFLEDWEKSAKLWGYNFSVLAEGQDWEGFKTYTNAIINFLKTRPSNEIIVNLDCYDVIISGPPEELLQKFLSFQKDIVTGGEDVCIFNCHRHSCHVNNDKYKWVNSGFVMGSASELLKLFEFIILDSPGDDQIGVAKYMDTYPHKVAVDGNQMIVANIRSIDELNCIANNRFQHYQTQHIPVIVHTPFMYSDFGARSEMVRHHALKKYKKPPFGTYVKGLISHLYKHLTKNPAYSSVLYTLYAIICVILVYISYKIGKQFSWI